MGAVDHFLFRQVVLLIRIHWIHTLVGTIIYVCLLQEVSALLSRLPGNHPIANEIIQTFETILDQTVLAKKIY